MSRFMAFIQAYTTEGLADYTTMKHLNVWLTPLFLGSQVAACGGGALHKALE